MLLNCPSLHALKFAILSKMEAMHHLALENMKNLKVLLELAHFYDTNYLLKTFHTMRGGKRANPPY